MASVRYGGGVVWAGIAVRYADGRVIAVEIDSPQGSIEIETEAIDASFGLAGYRSFAPGNRFVTAQLSGPMSRGWRMGEDYASTKALAAEVRAIEAPNSALPPRPPVERGTGSAVSPPG